MNGPGGAGSPGATLTWPACGICADSASCTPCAVSVSMPGRDRPSVRPRASGAGWAGLSANASLHLQLDEPVELERVLHRQFARDRLDEAAHDHRHRLVLG